MYRTMSDMVLGIALTDVPMLSPVLLGVSTAFGAPCRARLALVTVNASYKKSMKVTHKIRIGHVWKPNFLDCWGFPERPQYGSGSADAYKQAFPVHY